MNVFIFGGSGFIGTHLVKLLVNDDQLRNSLNIYVLDILLPGDTEYKLAIEEKASCVTYLRCDVRHPIDLNVKTTEKDIIYNLAAVHRTPGHPDYEYFETNILGAENIVSFAEKNNIKKILFTSSIAPYGASETLKVETTLPTPNTPYGISKLVAEKIHERWQVQEHQRELTILRPGVVFGKGECGNFTRLYKSLKKRYFFYPGRKNTIKACIYVKEVVSFMKYRMIDNSFFGIDIYNCTYEPAFTIEEICKQILLATNMKRNIPLIPEWVLFVISILMMPLGGKRLGLEPARIKKLTVSTNISGKKLANSGYKFKFTFTEAIKDWLKDSSNKGLE